MAVPTGRSDKRVAKQVAVELTRLDHLRLKETAITQNVSACGIRVATEHLWRPGDGVLLSSPEATFHSQARVVYYQHVENNRFAVGLELFAPVGVILTTS